MTRTNGLRRKDMRRIQKWAVNRIYEHEATILAFDMGSGKTVSVLTGMDDLLEDRVVKKVLIVAPLLVAKATFPDEIEEWRHLNHIDWTLIRAEDNDDDVIDVKDKAYRLARNILGLGVKEATAFAGRTKTLYKEKKRERLALNDAEVHIINKEALPWLWEFFGNGKRWPYDMLIVDEASMFKNGSRRTKTKSLSQFGAAAKARKLVKRVVLMTGTPAPKGLWNLWGLLYIADLGERLGTSRTKFETKYFDKDYMGWNLEPKPNSFRQITEKVSDIMFSLGPEDYPEIPPLVPIPVKVTLSSKVILEYNRFKRDMVSEIYDVEAVNAGVLTGKLLQFANGSMYREDGEDVWIHDEKIEALEDIVERANGEPVLVAYSFKFDLSRIKKVFKKAVIFGQGDVRKTKADWNAGRIELMLAHPQSVGHGQNIQFGGNINVWYGLTPDLEIFQQFNKRLHRPGQTKKVLNHYIIAKDTYDERMLPLLEARGSNQAEISRQFIIDLRKEY